MLFFIIAVILSILGFKFLYFEYNLIKECQKEREKIIKLHKKWLETEKKKKEETKESK